MAMHGPGFMMARGFRMDPNVTKQKITPGTVRRIARYARPYRLQLGIFLFATSLDACITVVNPLLLRELIDHGIVDHDDALARYDRGEFLYAPNPRATMNGKFYGDAVVPYGYFESTWSDSFEMLDFVADKSRFEQAVVIMRRRR